MTLLSTTFGSGLDRPDENTGTLQTRVARRRPRKVLLILMIVRPKGAPIIYLNRSEINAEPFGFVVEGPPLDPKDFRGSFFVPSGLFQDLDDVIFFHLVQRTIGL